MGYSGQSLPKKRDNRKRQKRVKRVEAPKPCRFEKEGIFEIDYRDVALLNRFVSSQGKLSAAKRNGNTAFYQRQLATAVKRARYLALLPFVGE
ncbi:MAG: 30S ribosomal protein S18 [Planctomycetota bacterium]|nr:30S ribosomal protein S18 [Planctomycetota bacterium]MCX8040700.1 30S ribosomal protein S18 [Planctomycetota bacterium]MDW8373458.1 30S ribosomal protein S18 [Planctomycetota bacterium]